MIAVASQIDVHLPSALQAPSLHFPCLADKCHFRRIPLWFFSFGGGDLE